MEEPPAPSNEQEPSEEEKKQLRDLFAEADKITAIYHENLKKAFKKLILTGTPAITVAQLTLNSLTGTILGMTGNKKTTRDIMMACLARSIFAMSGEKVGDETGE